MMGIVTQETFLFDDSIKANIAYGVNNLSDKEIEEAAKSIENIKNNIEGKEIRKVIYIKEKIINFNIKKSGQKTA